MLRDIKQAEEKARNALAAARVEADLILTQTRNDAVVRVEKAEEAARALKEAAIEKGKQAGAKEAETLVEKAQKEIEGEGKTYDAKISKAAKTVADKILGNLASEAS